VSAPGSPAHELEALLIPDVVRRLKVALSGETRTGPAVQPSARLGGGTRCYPVWAEASPAP
jgi:hypothetical protein